MKTLLKQIKKGYYAGKLLSIFRVLLQFRLHSIRLVSYGRARGAKKYYHVLTDKELKRAKSSETLYVFGSGDSLNEIAPETWEKIRQCDTIGFNYFLYQDFTSVKYHIIREIRGNDLDQKSWQPAIEEYARLIRENPFYRETILLVQGGIMAINGNRLVSQRLLPKSNPIFRFKNRLPVYYENPSESFSHGLVHGSGTLTDAINFGYIMGYSKIILVGVDLYDRRYFFWRRGIRHDSAMPIPEKTEMEIHNTVKIGIIEFIGKWAEFLKERNVLLTVLNPKSLLKEVLPVE